MLNLFIADLKMIARNKQYAFWSIMMPLMFTFIFGFFFSENASNGSIAIINNSNTPVAEALEKTVKDSKIFNVSQAETIDEAKDKIKNSKLGAALVIPEDFGGLSADSSRSVTLVIDPGNASVNATLRAFVDKFITGATYQAAGIKEPIYSITEEKTNSKDLSYFDFVMAGILGMALMNSSIIGIAVGMNKYKEDKILKRITTAPIKNWWFIAGEVMSRLVMNMTQISIILLVSYFVFDAHIYGNIFNIYILALIGAILFQLIGFVVAGLVKTTQAAEGAATAITMPMMFLGGVFFPIDTLPSWLYSVVQYLPIAPFLRMMRGVVLEGNGLFYNPANFIIIVVWVLVCLGIATWKFRLNEE